MQYVTETYGIYSAIKPEKKRTPLPSPSITITLAIMVLNVFIIKENTCFLWLEKPEKGPNRGGQKKKRRRRRRGESIGEKRVEEKEKAIRTQRRTRAIKTESQSERNQ
jgi:hypothetical protein